jgi:hypothetical protein
VSTPVGVVPSISRPNLTQSVLWFSSWVPSSRGAFAGVCIGLFLLALLERYVAALRRACDVGWAKGWVVGLSLMRGISSDKTDGSRFPHPLRPAHTHINRRRPLHPPLPPSPHRPIAQNALLIRRSNWPPTRPAKKTLRGTRSSPSSSVVRRARENRMVLEMMAPWAPAKTITKQVQTISPRLSDWGWILGGKGGGVDLSGGVSICPGVYCKLYR